MTDADRRRRFILLLTAIAIVSSTDLVGAGDGAAVQNEPAVMRNGAADQVLIEKMRMGRIIKIAQSRIELVPVVDQSWDDDVDGEPSPTRLRIADGAFDQLVFGQGMSAKMARVQAAAVVRDKIAAIETIFALTVAQRIKLELAGRGDIERLLDRIEEARQKFETYYIPDRSIFSLASDLKRETGPLWSELHSDIYDDDSLFAKVLRHELTEEQATKYNQRSSKYRSTLYLSLPDLMPSK